MTSRVAKQMKVIFIGRKNGFNNGIIEWLKEHYTLVGIFFVEENWSSLGELFKKFRKRRKRLGLWRTIDEGLFLAFHKIWYEKRERKFWGDLMPECFQVISDHNVPTFSCKNIHDKQWIETIRQLSPDILFSVCTHTIFKLQIFSIPRLGMFVLHEGITPEYRGLHTAAWAIINNEPQFIGYSLFKVDEGLDTGKILCQGGYPDAKEFGFCFRFAGHYALLQGLAKMKDSLDDLYEKDGQVGWISQAGRKSRLFRPVSMTEYMRWKLGT